MIELWHQQALLILSVALQSATIRFLAARPLTLSIAWLLWALKAPGTIFHEASHYLAGLVTGAQPCGFQVFPRRSTNPDGSITITYASVSFRNINPFNGVFVCFAPIVGFLICAFYFYEPLSFTSLTSHILISLLLGNIAISSTPSSQDRKVFLTNAVYPVMTLITLIFLLATFLSYKP